MHCEHYRTHNHPFFGHQHTRRRRFLTKEEKKELKEKYKEKKIQWMERYKVSLQKELKGVDERLEELKKDTE